MIVNNFPIKTFRYSRFGYSLEFSLLSVLLMSTHTMFLMEHSQNNSFRNDILLISGLPKVVWT